ncbi:hypothetical protein [Nannocystis sp. SCPEA4]|uniref:hypothetical protein n=1 Tax=Nannocystis sp. SCPEA4 TaxID=2996787 RepID=UPI00226FE636|nr:hypothetical protein [Nannocystis sp. SCPEA4]MCY1055413.1 hypothetical protein [Nannocystis sp. SCPEA4]
MKDPKKERALAERVAQGELAEGKAAVLDAEWRLWGWECQLEEARAISDEGERAAAITHARNGLEAAQARLEDLRTA